MTLPQAIVQFMGVFFLLGVIWKIGRASCRERV